MCRVGAYLTESDSQCHLDEVVVFGAVSISERHTDGIEAALVAGEVVGGDHSSLVIVGWVGGHLYDALGATAGSLVAQEVAVEGEHLALDECRVCGRIRLDVGEVRQVGVGIGDAAHGLQYSGVGGRHLLTTVYREGLDEVRGSGLVASLPEGVGSGSAHGFYLVGEAGG